MKSSTLSLSNSSPNHGRQRGATIVEMAFVVPLLFMVLFGIIQFGLIYFKTGAVNNAAREGARYGAVHPRSDDDSQPDSIQAFAKGRASGGVDPNRLAITVTFPDSTVEEEGRLVTRTNNRARGDKINVTVSYPMITFLPGMSSFQIIKSSTMRIEVDE